MRELQIKTMRSHYTPITVAEVRATGLLFIAVGNSKWYSYFGRQFSQVLRKLNMVLPYDPVIVLLGIYLQSSYMGNSSGRAHDWMSRYVPGGCAYDLCMTPAVGGGVPQRYRGLRCFATPILGVPF